MINEPTVAVQALEGQEGSSIGENKLEMQTNEGSQENQANEEMEANHASRGEA